MRGGEKGGQGGTGLWGDEGSKKRVVSDRFLNIKVGLWSLDIRGRFLPCLRHMGMAGACFDRGGEWVWEISYKQEGLIVKVWLGVVSSIRGGRMGEIGISCLRG